MLTVSRVVLCCVKSLFLHGAPAEHLQGKCFSVCSMLTYVFLYVQMATVLCGPIDFAVLPSSLLLSPALGPSHSSAGICSLSCHFPACFVTRRIQSFVLPEAYIRSPSTHHLCCFSLASARLLRSLLSSELSILVERKRKPGHINI